MRQRAVRSFALAVIGGLLAVLASACPAATQTHPKAVGSYAVVVSKATHADKSWRAVVDVLVEKYQARVIVHKTGIGEARAELAKRMPNYVCFVATPAEAGRDAVVAVHRLMRKLDDDPYTDAMWGILTGYDAADALRIAKYGKPLTVKNALCGTSGVGLAPFVVGKQFSEGKAGQLVVKTVDGKTVSRTCPADSTATIVKVLNDEAPDCFFTSGHATTRDWQMGFRYRNGQFRCKDGQLYGLDLKRNRHDINSPNPKVYLPVGNCLIGQIPDRECMALAWMHTGGAYQMIGYTVLTWYGYGGWGVRDLFCGQPGRFTLAEAFYFNNQALVHQLETRFPASARVDFQRYDLERDRSLLARLARTHKLRAKDPLGLLWDRDTVAFYGDPAWHAALPVGERAWEQKLTVNGDTMTFTVTTLKAGSWPGRPLAAFLPRRVGDVRILKGAEHKPLIVDNFILLPLKGEFAKGQVMEVRFTIGKVPAPDQTPEPDGAGAGKIVASLPEARRAAVKAALQRAGDNADELLSALTGVPAGQRAGMAFLVANMPDSDLQTIGAKLLIDNVTFAYRARAEAPWAKGISEAMFLNDVLPYAVVSETRENWRAEFYKRFKDKAFACGSAGAAAVMLNREVFDVLKVKYHATKRRKPHQSPGESAKLGWASCTGLSILLVDACRSVGVPARMAGIPIWVDKTGNHNWVEIWDGKWHVLGAAESKKLGDGWFVGKAAKTDSSKWYHRIYASSFAQGTQHFPLAWDIKNTEVPGVDVTASYCKSGS